MTTIITYNPAKILSCDPTKISYNAWNALTPAEELTASPRTTHLHNYWLSVLWASSQFPFRSIQTTTCLLQWNELGHSHRRLLRAYKKICLVVARVKLCSDASFCFMVLLRHWSEREALHASLHNLTHRRRLANNNLQRLYTLQPRVNAKCRREISAIISESYDIRICVWQRMRRCHGSHGSLYNVIISSRVTSHSRCPSTKQHNQHGDIKTSAKRRRKNVPFTGASALRRSDQHDQPIMQ